MKLPKRAPGVCAHIVAGKSLDAISAEPGGPKLATITRWMADCPEFRRAYARARALWADRLTEQVVQIADGLGEEAGEEAARSGRMRIEARKWAANRMAGPVDLPQETPPTPGRIVFCSPGDLLPNSPESSR
jgi:hypothetical protein